MGAMKSNRSVPASTVIPVLIYPDVGEAVAWWSAASGSVERVRFGENHRAQLQFGDGAAPRTDFEYGEWQYHAEDLAGQSVDLLRNARRRRTGGKGRGVGQPWLTACAGGFWTGPSNRYILRRVIDYGRRHAQGEP